MKSSSGYQQKERMSEFLQKYGKARAAGDIPSMRGLFAEYPEMGEQIGKGMTGISADTKESIGNMAAGFRTAAATGGGEQFIAKNASEFVRLGIDPADLQKRLKEEAKMYFQGMPQMDYSSPDAMKQSLMEIQEYTNNYNQQYNADVGGSKPSSKQQPAQQQSGYSSLWGD